MRDFTPLEIQLGREQTSMYLNTSKNILFLPKSPIELRQGPIQILGYFLNITSSTSLNRKTFQKAMVSYPGLMDEIRGNRKLQERDYGLIGSLVQERNRSGRYEGEIRGNLYGLLLKDASKRIHKKIAVGIPFSGLAIGSEIFLAPFVGIPVIGMGLVYISRVDNQFNFALGGNNEMQLHYDKDSKVILTSDSFKERFIKRHPFTGYNISRKDRSTIEDFFQN